MMQCTINKRKISFREGTADGSSPWLVGCGSRIHKIA
jgi:hypothetical protein